MACIYLKKKEKKKKARRKHTLPITHCTCNNLNYCTIAILQYYPVIKVEIPCYCYNSPRSSCTTTDIMKKRGNFLISMNDAAGQSLYHFIQYLWGTDRTKFLKNSLFHPSENWACNYILDLDTDSIYIIAMHLFFIGMLTCHFLSLPNFYV